MFSLGVVLDALWKVFFQLTGWICKETVEESVKLLVRHHLAVRTVDGRWRMIQNILDFPKCVPNGHTCIYIKGSKTSHYISSYASPSSV